MSLLTTNFTRKEFRCHGNDCCMNSAPINMDLVRALQELRDLLGLPLKVRSGFRCRKYNKSIGSEDTSQHICGNAADIEIPRGYTIDEFFMAVEMIPAFLNGGIGKYPTKGFLHLDVGPQRRWEQV